MNFENSQIEGLEFVFNYFHEKDLNKRQIMEEKVKKVITDIIGDIQLEISEKGFIVFHTSLTWKEGKEKALKLKECLGTEVEVRLWSYDGVFPLVLSD